MTTKTTTILCLNLTKMMMDSEYTKNRTELFRDATQMLRNISKRSVDIRDLADDIIEEKNRLKDLLHELHRGEKF